jgi:hypothetical protein
MLTDIFFATTLIFVYGTFGLLGYTLCKQCCRKYKKKENPQNYPNIQTYIQMRKVFQDIELYPDIQTYIQMRKVFQDIKIYPYLRAMGIRNKHI